MSQPANRRRWVIIDPQLQKRIVFAGAWPACLGIASAILLLGHLSSKLGQEALEAGTELPSLPWLFLTTAVLLVMVMAFVIWTSLRISHRVAGPAYNIGKVLERVRGGELTARVRLREGDYLHGVADTLNTHLDWLEQHPPQAGYARATDAPAAEVAIGQAANAPTPAGA